MTPDEQKTLDLLLKKQSEEAGAPVLQLIQGGGEKNVIVAKLEEFTAMARRGEVFDFVVGVVLQPNADGTQQMKFAWGSTIPSVQALAAAGALQFQLNRHMPIA